ncbi:hypothetical protein DFH06DRAFT_1145436 [Mycena polygramma]|nr:hypothetical protein DFH06DRAFT_1145436 [Mycena polygramma]
MVGWARRVAAPQALCLVGAVFVNTECAEGNANFFPSGTNKLAVVLLYGARGCEADDGVGLRTWLVELLVTRVHACAQLREAFAVPAAIPVHIVVGNMPISSSLSLWQRSPFLSALDGSWCPGGGYITCFGRFAVPSSRESGSCIVLGVGRSGQDQCVRGARKGELCGVLAKGYPEGWVACARTVVPRMSTADAQLGGYAIPAGTSITFDIYTIRHTETFWKDLYAFNPDRFEQESLKSCVPFALGPRQCPARYFAMYA